MLRVDSVDTCCRDGALQVSLSGVALIILKLLSENTEPCLPAHQICNPVLEFNTFTGTYQRMSRTLEVRHATSRHAIFMCIPNHTLVCFVVTSVSNGTQIGQTNVSWSLNERFYHRNNHQLLFT